MFIVYCLLIHYSLFIIQFHFIGRDRRVPLKEAYQMFNVKLGCGALLCAIFMIM
jgi:hypothetical protein